MSLNFLELDVPFKINLPQLQDKGTILNFRPHQKNKKNNKRHALCPKRASNKILLIEQGM